MPQRLKEAIRARIIGAATAVFAERGYTDAKVAEVAERAGIATSNIYKYFENKEALFQAVVTPTVAARLLRLLRARIRELEGIANWAAANEDGSERARQLLGFWIKNRLTVVILSRGASGTRFSHVRGLMIQEMERLAVGYARKRNEGKQPSPELRFLLRLIFSHTVDTIASILAVQENETEIRTTIALFWRYQLSGLQNLLNHSLLPKTNPAVGFSVMVSE
jgi:AcrR family transcriptional regulator